MGTKTQLELDIEQREIDAAKAQIAKEKKEQEALAKSIAYDRKEFRTATEPLVEWAGAEYTGDQSLKFTFKGEVYSLSVDRYFSEGDNESGIPSGWCHAWYLHGKGKEVYVAGDSSYFKPDRDGKHSGWMHGPIRERIIKAIQEIDEETRRRR
jgi:hypothetical protein